jgi:hypothetical protein
VGSDNPASQQFLVEPQAREQATEGSGQPNAPFESARAVLSEYRDNVDIDLVAFSAELSALEEHLSRCRDRIEGLITPLRSSEREDILSPLYESERLLRSAERAISRAERATR